MTDNKNNENLKIEDTEKPIKENNPENKAPDKKAKPKIKYKSKYAHMAVSAVMIVIFITVVVLVNVLSTMLTDKYPSLNIDLTPGQVHSLSDQSVEVAKSVSNPTEIIIIGDEEVIRANSNMTDAQVNSYNGQIVNMDQVASLADRLSEVNPKITVQFVDLVKNPTFTEDYPDETISDGCVIVKSGDKHSLLSYSDLIKVTMNSQTQLPQYTTIADGSLANAIANVNLERFPMISIATGHEEYLDTASLASFKKVFSQKGFETQEFSIVTEDIPQNSDVLMLPAPKSDYSEEEIAKIRNFLSDNTAEYSRTLLVTCFPAQGEMPNLTQFLEEWGIRPMQGYVAETSSESQAALNNADPTILLAKNAFEEMTGEYPYLISEYTTPIEVLFEYNNDISVKKLWVSSSTSAVITSDISDASQIETGEQVLAAYASKYASKNGLNLRENVVVFGSSVAFVGNYIESSTYKNKAYTTDLLTDLAGISSSNVVIPDTEINALDIMTTKTVVTNTMLLTFTVGIPLLILLTGLVIFLRRRHL